MYMVPQEEILNVSSVDFSSVQSTSLGFFDVDYLTLATTISIAIIGWIFALFLQKWNSRTEHQKKIQYDIYQKLVDASSPLHEAVAELNAKAFPPFILMESSMTQYELRLTKIINGVSIPYSEQECVHEGGQKWRDHKDALFQTYFKLQTAKQVFAKILEDWSAAIESLIPTQKILWDEWMRLGEKLHADIQELSMWDVNHGHDWRQWNREEIDEIEKRIQANVLDYGNYLHDFMVLVHNDLLASHFWYKKPIRKTLDPNFKVLTKEGIVVRLEDNYEEKLKNILAKEQI